ncbi:MAG: hypothetical protein M0Q42_04125 [Xanthomonadales bacterium]|nr:hypothetical protein [Xanthomonadales bacterium]
MIVRKSAPGWALLCALSSALVFFSPATVRAATPDQLTEQEAARALVAAEAWSFNGGEAMLRFNTSLLEMHGISVGAPEQMLAYREHDAISAPMPIRPENGIRFAARDGALTRFVDGSLHVDGQFHVDLPDGSRLDYDGFEVRVSPINPMHLDVIGNDGQVWFYVNHMMWETIDDDTRFHLRAADLNVTHALAARVAAPELAGNYVGELTFISPLRTRGQGRMGALPITGDPTVRGTPCVRGATPCFHGDAHPDGGIYEADVLMQAYSMSFTRCRRSTGSGLCDGLGADDGEVVFTPSSTLRNSNKPNTADIPWYEKFTGHTNPWGYPYPNADQHPYLIWNIYRIVDGQLEQIAASGVKHAWLTTNTGCSSPFGGHMLSPNCADTYGTGNNDAYDDLGPRSEIDPAGGWFGRCGSIFDTNCDGFSNSVSTSGYRDRLIVRESQLSVPGAIYYSDSWYIVQDDIDIYNTMMHRTMTPTPGGQQGWTPGNQGSQILGPMINTWVNPAANPTHNVEIATGEGHTRVAVKVKELAGCPAGSGLGGTCWRYDYAVQNFDFARVVRGDPPNDQPPNLRILSNKGFGSFTVPVGEAGVHLESGHFADIDIDPGNNWTAVVGEDTVTWTAPDGNELNWGMLFRFSLVTDVAPNEANVAQVGLGVAGPGAPSSLGAAMLVPAAGELPLEYQVTAIAGAGGSIDPASQMVPAGSDAGFSVSASAGFVVVSVVGDTCTPQDNGDGTWTAAAIQADCQVLASFNIDGDPIFANGFESPMQGTRP